MESYGEVEVRNVREGELQKKTKNTYFAFGSWTRFSHPLSDWILTLGPWELGVWVSLYVSGNGGLP